jgi:hypothetical protein
MEVGRPMEDEQAAQEHPATAEPPVAGQSPATAGTESSPGFSVTDGSHVAAEIAATGEPRVDAALAGLGRLALLPVGEHPAVFEQVHRGLREVLGELDGGAGGGSGSGRPAPGGGPAGAGRPAGR